MQLYFWDYPNEPIGNGNPYYRCTSCKISDPQINGTLEGHAIWCEWRQEKERDLGIIRFYDSRGALLNDKD